VIGTVHDWLLAREVLDCSPRGRVPRARVFGRSERPRQSACDGESGQLVEVPLCVSRLGFALQR
jgi:hypothetical protein